MPDDDRDPFQMQGEQQRDRERIEMEIREATERAQRLGLSDADVRLLKWDHGIQQRAR